MLMKPKGLRLMEMMDEEQPERRGGGWTKEKRKRRNRAGQQRRLDEARRKRLRAEFEGKNGMTGRMIMSMMKDG